MDCPVPDEVRRQIQHDCTMLMHRYTVNADHHPEQFTEVFCDDVVWVRPGMEMHGREEMQAFIDANTGPGSLTRHMITTVDIRVVDENSATGTSYALVFRDDEFGGTLPVPMNTIELVVEYRDEFALTDAGWRIARHEALHVFRR